MKTHMKSIICHFKVTYVTFSTVLAQIEVCLNSRPLVPLSHDDDGIEALSPGHYLIGRLLEALPDYSLKYADSISSLRLWQLVKL